MSLDSEPFTVWYLEGEETQGELETADGRLLDLESGNPIRILREEAKGRDIVEGHLRWNGHALPSYLEETYDIDADEAANHLVALEDEGICYSKEWSGAYSPGAGW